jgi:catechol 2,3-dioxygenase-like lactoylglutathione lyase family enzyme
MRRSFVVHLVLVVTLIPACGPESITPGSVATSPSASAPQRIRLPPDFPVLPGAVSVAIPDDDPGLIGHWASDRRGSDAYDFFVAALPAAGYPIVGLYPGDGAAVIRFRVPDGTLWQVVMHSGLDGQVAIEIRLDRP